MIISIHQPQYLPWGGYFDKIDKSDIFVFLDNVQYEKNGWQNRNKIRTNQGIKWLTVPVRHKLGQKILDIEINGNKWVKKHINTIEQNYKCKNNSNWKRIKKVLEKEHKKLLELNCELSKIIANILGFNSIFVKASEIDINAENPDDRIIEIVKKLKGEIYIAGAGGKNYMDLDKYPFKVIFQKYSEPEPLSVIDKILL